MDAIEKKPKKIDGYDSWDVESAVSTLKRAEEIKADSKFLKVVLKEMEKEAAKLNKTKAEKKKRTPLRNIQKYGTWLKLQKSGGSVRTKRELQGLSGADADAVKKLLYGKKR
jgi:hypothetical protein